MSARPASPWPWMSAGVIIACLAAFWLARPSRVTSEVILYCAQDQVYAEPLLAEFTRQTGLRVRALYDSEAVKTVGLANRLLSEREHPQCDVFWGNEELRTRQLAARDVFAETNGWTSFGARSRRIIINTNRLALAAAPRSLGELTNAAWRQKVALAYPLFGTTATHFLALRQAWTPAVWEAWCRALAANQPFLVEGNSMAARLVARGEAWIGLTDSDDAAAELAAGAPLALHPLDADSLLIPNTVAVIRGAPHADAARRLFDYLQSAPVAQALVSRHALEGVAVNPDRAKALAPDWPVLLAELEPATAKLKDIFLR